MPNIGDVIKVPLEGYVRFDEIDSNYEYTGTGWINSTFSWANKFGQYVKTNSNPPIDSTIRFNFTGSEIIVYGCGYSGLQEHNIINIDGVDYNMGNWSQLPNNSVAVSFYINTLSDCEHCVEIKPNNSIRIYFDGVDLPYGQIVKKYNVNLYNNKYLIYKDNKYISILDDFYDINLDTYVSCDKIFSLNGFKNIGTLFNNITDITLKGISLSECVRKFMCNKNIVMERVLDNIPYLNPSDKYSTITLSNNNRTIQKEGSSSYGGIRANIPITSGKIYWEVDVDRFQGTNTNVIIGVCLKSQSLGGFTSYSGFTQIKAYYNNGNKVNPYSKYGLSYKEGDTIGVLLDMDNGNISFRVNNVDNGIAFNNLLGLEVYPCIFAWSNTTCTFNPNVANMKYGIPKGYSPYSYESPYLLIKDNYVYTIKDGGIVKCESNDLTLDNFKNNGFTDLSEIYKVNVSEYEIILYDMNPDTPSKMRYFINPFKPIDKIGSNFEVCMEMPKLI